VIEGDCCIQFTDDLIGAGAIDEATFDESLVNVHHEPCVNVDAV
jgi:hypothetical protein